MRMSWLACVVIAGCGAAPGPMTPGEGSGGPGPGPVTGEESGGETADTRRVPDVRCAGAPEAGAAGRFRHTRSRILARLGGPRHRGFDLVTSEGAPTQTLEGWISYTVVDKALEDEDVDVLACLAGEWRRVGSARTDDDGRFALELSGAARLPVGMRDMFVSVVGDRSGVGFLAYVAPDGMPLIVSDVDGTLTSSENAFIETVVLGREPDERAGAPRAYEAAMAKGYQLVYVTARGNQFTTATRGWLASKGFPRGPVRLAPTLITLPGDDTVEYKIRTIERLVAGLMLAAGVGNRASDITAYTSTRLAADRIFIELPEFVDEVQPLLETGAAIGFSSYDELFERYLAKLP
jgi:hypothetical protein